MFKKITYRTLITIIICILILSTTMPTFVSMKLNTETKNNNFEKEKYALIRLSTVNGIPIFLKDVDIITGKTGEYIDIIVTYEEYYNLLEKTDKIDVLIWDLESYIQKNIGAYHTFDEIVSTLNNISNNYPEITSLYSIGTSYENRSLWCLEITDNPGVDEGEPGVFFMGLHHAREWPTIEICLYIIDQLTSKYGNDPTITDLINNRRIWIVPCVNPDGYSYDHDQFNGTESWRKNRQYFSEFETYGVDLNRNYGGSSNGDIWGAWGSVAYNGATHDSDGETYCGPNPFSELETQAIKNMFIENDISASITWHTHGELVLWPWGYSGDLQTPDDNYMSQVGIQIAERITQEDGTGTYEPTQAAGLYPTTGDTDDWAYGYYHYIIGKPLFIYTIEACQSFHPDENKLDQICKENYDGALYLLEEAENIKNNVKTRVTPPIINDLTTDLDGNFTITWTENNPNADVLYFKLEQLNNLSIEIDNCEDNTKQYWNLDGFIKTDDKYHSMSNSYKSHDKNNMCSSMTSTYPIPVNEDTVLSFWCCFDTEENNDYAFVEVSRDGRYYEILDTFTGSSNNWEYKEYSLEDYKDESVFIRFRYATDTLGRGDGFYVDDITPVSNFKSIKTISDSIQSNSYEIYNLAKDIYYYRVKGFNNEYGWGDYSTLEKIKVNGANNPPNKPIINGPLSGKIDTEYTYIFKATDPDGDKIQLYINWGDGNIDEWIGPYQSDEEVNISHIWTKQGKYTIKAKAKDDFGYESEWSESLIVTMPRLKQILNRPLFKFLGNHQLLYDVLKRFIKN
ncbi:MAG: hypothetical protein BV456_08170 [Thermoplasmata archaeon M8B2D]|nr:MAG: hypothetical protein BV456_08170 [Thermoplasmata archaeon M8B2D]